MQNTSVITSIELFPFYKAFFCKDGTWERLTDQAKMKHCFMLLRLLSIKHPEYIQCLNQFHSVQLLDALHNAFKSQGSQPGWAYTKVKENASSKHLLDKYPKWLIEEFCQGHGLEKKSFEFLFSVHQTEVIEHLDKSLDVFNQVMKPTKK